MARQLRIEFPGVLYGITNRGNEKKAIFRDSEDKESFLDVLVLVIDRFGWLCHAFTLMPNHYHLLLETSKGNLSRGMMVKKLDCPEIYLSVTSVILVIN